MEMPPTMARNTIQVTVTERGFEPSHIEVLRGDSVLLVFKRKVERTCAKRVIVELDARERIERDLPLNQPVVIPLSFDGAGELGFTCGMQMLGGTIVVR